MAKAVEETEGPGTAGLVDNFEWENVHEEAPDQLVFDTIDDTYIGEYVGSEEIDPHDEKDPDKRFTQLKFRDQEGLKVLNAGFELREAFAEIKPNSVTRIRLAKLVDVGQASPMKSYRIDVAKSAAR